MRLKLRDTHIFLSDSGHSVYLVRLDNSLIADAAKQLQKKDQHSFGTCILDDFLRQHAEPNRHWFVIRAVYQGSRSAASIGLCCATIRNTPKIIAEVAIGITDANCGQGFELPAHILLAAHLHNISVAELRIRIPHTVIGQRRISAFAFAMAMGYRYHHHDYQFGADEYYFDVV